MSLSLRSIVAWLIRAGVVALLVRELVTGHWAGAGGAVIFLGVSALWHLVPDRLPAWFDPTIALVALVNALGFVLHFYRRVLPYDEIAHTLTLFTITLAAHYLIYRRERLGDGIIRWTALFTLGVAIGALWEIAEWIADLVLRSDVVPGLSDSMIDLVVDAGGAAVAALIVLRLLRTAQAVPAMPIIPAGRTVARHARTRGTH
jgi:hypothetical protein